MGERLRARDLAFLTSETTTTPMHNATVEIFDPGTSGFDHDTLVQLIADRIAFVPRYRQRVRWVPGHLANPVWVDDAHFDLGYHVRRSALPRPGRFDQLRELVARIVSRPLDRSRPLWEVYFVEGLEGGRVAVLSKAHQALVDGAQIVDLAQVLLDRTPERRELGSDEWRPAPSGLVLGAGARGGPRHGRHAVHGARHGRRAPRTRSDAAPMPRPGASARSSTRSPTGAPSRTRRSAARSPSSAAS